MEDHQIGNESEMKSELITSVNKPGTKISDTAQNICSSDFISIDSNASAHFESLLCSISDDTKYKNGTIIWLIFIG